MKKLHKLSILILWYLEHIELLNFRPRTIKDYSFELNYFYKYLLNEHEDIEDVKDITPVILRAFASWLFNKKLSIGTIIHKTAVLKSFFKALYKENKIYIELSEHIHIPKSGKKLPSNILSEQEMKNCYSILESKLKNIRQTNKYDILFLRNYAIFEVLYSTGIRKSELINLKVEHLHYSDCLVEIINGKGGKDRVVPIGKGSLEIVNDYMMKLRSQLNINDLDYIFLSNRGNKLGATTLSASLKSIIDICKIKKNVTVHTLRHTCATHMLNNGSDIRYVQELLGHTNLNSTQVYTHLAVKDLLVSHAKHHPREQEGFFS